MRHSGRFTRKLFISIALGVLIFLAMSLYADMPAVMHALGAFDWRFLPAALFLALVNYILRFFRWDYYLSRINIDIPRGKSFIIFMSGLAMSVTPGKVGELLKSYLLREQGGIAISRSAPVVVAERVTDLAAIVLLSAFGVMVFGYGAEALLGGVALVAAMLAVVASRPLFTGIMGFMRRVPRIAGATSRIEAAYESARALMAPGALLWATALGTASWFAECLGLWLVFEGFGSPVSVFNATFVYAFSTLVGAVSMLPGGLGVTEGSMTALLVVTGAPLHLAVASTLIIRVCTLWFAVLLGLAALMRGHRTWKLDEVAALEETEKEKDNDVADR